MIPRPPSSPLFPHATLFRSASRCGRVVYPPYMALILERHARSSSRRFPASSARSSARLRFSRGSSERSKNSSGWRSEEHTSELQSRQYLVCRLLLEKKKHTI